MMIPHRNGSTGLDGCDDPTCGLIPDCRGNAGKLPPPVRRKEISLREADDLAKKAITALDTLHGDPQKNGNWLRERRLAEIVRALVARIEAATHDIEVIP